MSRRLSENREPATEKPFWPIFMLIFVKYEQLFSSNGEEMDSKWRPLSTASIRGKIPGQILLWLSLVLLCCSPPLYADQDTSIKDLDYGVAFFDLYQERYYRSAVNLGISLQQQKLQHHQGEAELLLGSILLYYGMHDEAEAIFLRHTQRQQNSVSDRAWFYMAKVRYQRGLYDAGLQALLKIQGTLPDELQRERHRLQIMLLMGQGRFSLAAEVNKQTKAPGDLFAQYNLAVALERAQKNRKSSEALRQLILAEVNNQEGEELQHKARIILAQRYLEYGKTQNAIVLLHQVPMDTVFFDQALITLSWAYYKQGENIKALAPLRLLKERNSRDIEAKEAWLLEGYVQEHANASHEAKKSYESAISHYQREIARVDEVITSLGDGHFLNQLLPQLRGTSQGLGWEARIELPKANTPYMAVMLSSYPFFEALRNLRDLRYLQSQLSIWRDDIPSYQHMIKLRQMRYNEFLPLLELVKKNNHYQSLVTQHQQLVQQLDTIDQQQAIYQLLDEKAEKQRARLSKIETIIEKLPEGDLLEGYQQRYQRLKGLLTWQLTETFKVRSWQRRKELRAQQRLLDEVAEKREVLSQTELTTPQMFSQYEQYINQLSAQMETLNQQVEQLYTRQEEELLELAVEALQRYRSRLALYRDQAYYRVAYIKDSALNSDEAAQ